MAEDVASDRTFGCSGAARLADQLDLVRILARASNVSRRSWALISLVGFVLTCWHDGLLAQRSHLDLSDNPRIFAVPVAFHVATLITGICVSIGLPPILMLLASERADGW